MFLLFPQSGVFDIQKNGNTDDARVSVHGARMSRNTGHALRMLHTILHASASGQERAGSGGAASTRVSGESSAAVMIIGDRYVAVMTGVLT